MGKIGTLYGLITLGITLGASILKIFIIFIVVIILAALISILFVDTTNIDLDEIYKFKEKLGDVKERSS